MSSTVILKNLPDRMVHRILPEGISVSELAYANIKTVLLIPTEGGGTYVVFDIKGEWNYLSDIGIDELFGLMSGGRGL